MARRPSSIDRLPDDIKDLIGMLRSRGRTLDEIIAKLQELDPDNTPSRTALGRHIQKIDAVAEKMRRSRDVADALVRRLGDAEPDKATRLNIELMHSVIFELLASIGEKAQDESGSETQSVTLDPMQVMLMAKAIDHLGKAAKDDVARTIAVEKRAFDKAKAEAAKVAVQIGRRQGLTREAVEEFRHELLGIERPKKDEEPKP